MEKYTATIKNVPSKEILSKYVMIASECCATKKVNSMSKAQFTFGSKEDLDCFEMMVNNLSVFAEKT